MVKAKLACLVRIEINKHNLACGYAPPKELYPVLRPTQEVFMQPKNQAEIETVRFEGSPTSGDEIRAHLSEVAGDLIPPYPDPISVAPLVLRAPANLPQESDDEFTAVCLGNAFRSCMERLTLGNPRFWKTALRPTQSFRTL